MNTEELARRISEHVAPEGRHVVHVCGMGGSGKTTISQQLAERAHLGGSIMRLDWYLKWPTMERRERIAKALRSGDGERMAAEENPVNWHDWRRFRADLETLRRSGQVRLTDAWNQLTGEKDLCVECVVRPDDFIICEGIYLLHPPVRMLADVAVLLAVPEHVARQRAEQRDAHRSDAGYLAYKQHLVEKYDLPYFTNYATAATFVAELDGNAEP